METGPEPIGSGAPPPHRAEGGAQQRMRGQAAGLSQTAKSAPEPSPLRGEGRVRGSVARARFLRRNETEAEHVLWQILRGRQLDGHKFVRQFAIGPYVADFACREAALVVELDGSQHVGSAHDEVRTAFLNSEGYALLRFWNNDVLANIQGIAESILAALALHPSPGGRYAPATLSPEGRGTRGANAATSRQRSRRLTGGVARLVKE